MQLSMECFLGGLVFCGLALVASYLAQLRLYTDSGGRAAPSPQPPRWLSLASFLCLLSIGAFAVGSFLVILRF
jgi:hypothetical protein